uniref:Immunoglobulin V-set domain-containing protein n=1 Tax=Seriola dumerili TaxID=41447 RepID=A0A3B4U4T5_SERDU
RQPLFELFYLNLCLSTEIPNFTRSPMVGETLTYWCDYSSHTAYTYKFICKGEDPSVCERLVSTQAHKMNNGKFSLNDDRLKRNITITVRDVTADDAGTYWCGAKRSNNESSNPFFHRFIMTVGESCCFIVWMKSDPDVCFSDTETVQDVMDQPAQGWGLELCTSSHHSYE